MAGPDGRDPAVPPVPLGEPSAVDLGALRVAVHADNGIATPTPETTDAVHRAASALRDAGAVVEEDRPAALADAPGLFHRLVDADAGTRLRAQIESLGTTQMHPMMIGLLENVERSDQHAARADRAPGRVGRVPRGDAGVHGPVRRRFSARSTPGRRGSTARSASAATPTPTT